MILFLHREFSLKRQKAVTLLEAEMLDKPDIFHIW